MHLTFHTETKYLPNRANHFEYWNNIELLSTV